MDADRREPLGHDAPLDAYERRAVALLAALEAHEPDAEWHVKWEHPRFRGADVSDVRASSLTLDDARTVVAREYAFETWPDVESFVEAMASDAGVRRFEAAVEAVVSGDADRLRSMIREHPALVRERSARRHHATLLHYVAANGVEGCRQRTPANAVEITTILLEAGAEPDALADMYDKSCTTMSMLVSSAHPAGAGLQAALAVTLLDHGATLEGPGTAWQSSVMTALAFGYLDTARALARRGGPPDTLPAAAGLGSFADVVRLLPDAGGHERHAALALAAQHGHADIVGALLDEGESPDRYNPDGFHPHSTPLHQATSSDRIDVVRVLVERGARLDMRDTIYHATPLGWAEYGKRTAVAAYLRSHGAPA